MTRWLHDKWYYQWEADSFPAAMTLARLLNNIDTLQWLGFPYRWDPEEISWTLKGYRDTGARVFNPAYIVTTCGKKMDKLDYVVRVADDVLKVPSPLKCYSLTHYFGFLTQVGGLSAGFLAAQVIADLKHTPLMTEERCPDWWTFVAMGPGSKRGLNRLMGRDPNAPVQLPLFKSAIDDLQRRIYDELGLTLEAQDIQNCLCEFDKYMRAKTGQGRPKQNYNGASDGLGHDY